MAQPHHPGHRPSPVHHRERRPHRGPAGGAHRRAGAPCRAAGPGRLLRPAASAAVPRRSRAAVTWSVWARAIGGLAAIGPERLWYGRHPLSLGPAAAVLALLRGGPMAPSCAYRRGLAARSVACPVPVIVVGNLTRRRDRQDARWCCGWRNWRVERGWRPGILTRGYGGSARDWPRRGRPDDRPADLVGDEPVLLARRGGCPVVAGPDRVADGELAIGAASAATDPVRRRAPALSAGAATWRSR